MKFQELKSSLNGAYNPIYLIEGEDAFLRESAVKLLKDKYLQLSDLNYNCFEGKELKYGLDDFIAVLKSYPFMSEKRVVLVRDYYPSAQEIKNKILVNCFDNPEDTSLLIIVNSEKSEQLKKLKNICVVDCSKADLSLLIRWIQARTAKSKIIISQSTASMLADYCQCDLTKINGETEKLIAYVGDSMQIQPEDIEEVVIKETDYQIYEFVEFVAKMNYQKAYNTLMNMLDKNQDKQRLFVSLYNHFRRLFYISASAMTDGELATYLGVKEYAIKKSRSQATNFKIKKLKKVLEKFSELDLAFKSGETTVDSALFNSIFNVLVND